MLITENLRGVTTIKNVSLIILFLKMCFIFGQGEFRKKIIVIDPGHGGKDPGAIGVNHFQEKDVVLDVAKEIVRLNQVLFMDKFEIYLTRYTDTMIALGDRAKLAKTLQADIFVSLHCNHADNPKAKGVEVYVSKREGIYQEDSIWLGYLFEKSITDKLGFKSRGVKFANFQVLRQTVEFCPSVLLELGFLSNFTESNFFMDPSNVLTLGLLLLNNPILGSN
ncbi:N-acetylmuramoyl-L-alanine amidase family protein [Maribacter polysaccharolyticus]|uniref:N-acetylmuramoyl-L-alanine amidase family protein n=1 Tax=Maribacter polysaccharolyticus TaxID=3020831 RepID=UPI00237F79BF|nr:N-acetylmuramoyl-L-alanine amidase [Maribacter polysaccharolyticus]MDE3742114.1 N-acetylmuramoyl-L-alanine amidase [Maribacter polysaccharolyticus]